MNTDGDVLLFQTINDGDITITDGITQLTGGFDTAFYLSLFGGNFEDDGTQDNPLTWWGNLLENEPEGKYVSRTQNLLRGLPATSGNLRRVEEAARRDLQWFLDTGIATSVIIEASIPEYGKVEIAGSITVQGEEIPFSYTENWKAAQSEGL
jgi:phage gp46-like protein